MIDHFYDGFNILNRKFKRDLHFIIAGDTNDLNLGPILDLSPNLLQIVKDYTRMDPPAILDPIIMTLACFYQRPDCIEPLGPDSDKCGKKSDHKIVIAKPISKSNPTSVREKRKIKSRPLTSSGIKRMQDCLISESWQEILEAQSAHNKADLFQSKILKIYQECFPEKIKTFTDDDQPWITHRLKLLDRKRKRIFRKGRQSEKWVKSNKLFKKDLKKL